MNRAIVYLVGFMGAGKTEVGRRLAELAGWSFVDLDEEIERRARMSVAAIFGALGEPQFRAMERSELRMASGRTGLVVAVGGGAFCDAENRAVIDSTGISVWLDAPLEVMLERCRDRAGARPLLSGRDQMAALLDRRRPSYEAAALRIETAGLDVEAVARRILDRLAETESGRPEPA